MSAGVLAAAMLLDAALGEPRWLWSRLPHPAVLTGRAIGRADAAFNRGTARKAKGTLLVVALLFAAFLIGGLISALPLAPLWEALIVAILLAQKSLAQHVGDVARALAASVPEGRRAVARIVGRDTGAMDEAAAARAAIESAAENLSDGVVAPALFYLFFGLPGILAYKAINTADSMIGYRTDRHEDFGRAAARADDVLNWAPARATAALLAIVSGTLGDWRAIRADAALHRSPNAGWPEAAMARALGVALAGPRSYDGAVRDYAFVNASGRHAIGAPEIRAAVTWLWRAWALLLVLVLASAAVF